MKKTLLTLFCALFALNAFSQQEVVVDLSETSLGDIEISSGTIKLVLLNTLSSTHKYKVETTVTSTVIPPISLDKVNGAQASVGTTNLISAVICPGGTTLLTDIGNLFTATTELILNQKFDKVYIDVAALPAVCQNEAKPEIANAEALRRQISYISDLTANQKVTVKITRFPNGTDIADKTWKFSMSTESKLEKWLIHYGFTYQPSIINRNSQYFAKADPTAANTYTINKMNGNPERQWENASPSIILTHPFGNRYRDFMPGFSILAGTNFSTYNAGLGFSGIIAYNGLVTVGAMYTQKYHLNGQYKEGDIIKDNLTFDQLHSKRGGIELFFSIGIRLDKNPFKSESSEGSTEPKK